MASTYSSLKIQLMGTGENSGTWGTITNTNLGTALEEAIVGSADVNFSSADVTLTLTDTNSSQSARNLRLNLTGSVGAPQNLIVPAIEKVYIINNGLTQTITVKNASGTGISVPAGKTEYVYNNGTNVVEAINHLTSLTLDTALPISSGGTGSTSTTYANLQSNVSGVLPVANGGTGSATAAFSGANITSLNASAVSSGTLSNDRTTAASANGASTIVARDASGNFAGATITGTTFSGSGASLTSLNASNISSGTVGTARLASGTANSSTFLRGDQTWAALSVPEVNNDQVFTSSGTFNVPAGVSRVKVSVIGAGGNGGNGAGSVCSGGGGGGGGAGGYIVDYVAVTPGGTASVTVGTNGGTRTSSFAGTSTITASGGNNGSNGVNGGDPSSGASGASTVFGVTYYMPGALRRGGGAFSAGAFAGTSAGAALNNGQVWGHGFGAGGSGNATSSTLYAGVGYGAGGGGGGSPSFSYVQAGGAGTNGLVIVEW